MRALRLRPLVLAACLGILLGPLVAFSLLGQQDTAGARRKDKEKGGGPKVRTTADSARREAKQRAERAHKSAQRALFAESQPLEFSLIANYGAIARDRDTLSTKRFTGTVVVKDSLGADRTIPVQLRTRGHFRLLSRNCRFVPLRITFPDSGVGHTPFAGQRSVKLGTHCQNNDGRYDDYTRREYLAYTLFNAVTPKSFRARLARGTYIDSATGKSIATRVAMFIESEDDLARRMGGKIQELRGALFDDLLTEPLMDASLFQYAIGNTDWSLFGLHNARVMVMPDGKVIPVIYDFDFSGLVNTHYAGPDPRMGIKTVRDRLYRGPCQAPDAFVAAAARFTSRKAAMLSAIASVPDFSGGEQRLARDYLDGFFTVIESPGRFRREVIEACEKKPGM